jgi:DNA-binding CsgD family transcriptional regulator
MVTKFHILTKEERLVLILTAFHPNSKHLSYEEISQRLDISVTKVKTLIHQACEKLSADNRNEAVLLALRKGEIQLNELLSLNELADILSSVDPDALYCIANFVRQNPKPGSYPLQNDYTVPVDRRQSGLLTNRERDVLILSSQGFTNIEIAKKLCMTTSAVRTFLNRAFKKLGARKKADAIQAALKQQEISVGEISSQEELTYYLAPLGAEAIERLAQLVDGKRGKETGLPVDI